MSRESVSSTLEGGEGRGDRAQVGSGVYQGRNVSVIRPGFLGQALMVARPRVISQDSGVVVETRSGWFRPQGGLVRGS